MISQAQQQLAATMNEAIAAGTYTLEDMILSTTVHRSTVIKLSQGKRIWENSLERLRIDIEAMANTDWTKKRTKEVRSDCVSPGPAIITKVTRIQPSRRCPVCNGPAAIESPMTLVVTQRPELAGKMVLPVHCRGACRDQHGKRAENTGQLRNGAFRFDLPMSAATV
jgi:hypothetical protein